MQKERERERERCTRLRVDCEMHLTTPSHSMAARVEEVVTALRLKAADDSKISAVKAQVIAPSHGPCGGQSKKN